MTASSETNEKTMEQQLDEWKNGTETELADKQFRALADHYGLQEIIGSLAASDWYARSRIAKKMLQTGYFSGQKKDSGRIRTIAAYYHSISNGGAQRVVALLCNIWASFRDAGGYPLYRVILITDEGPKGEDYPINGCVTRVYLPDYRKSEKEHYRERAAAWERILNENSIDVVVSSMWVAPCTLWDMLCVKGHPSKPAFVIHSHNFCGVPFLYRGDAPYELSLLYQLCDGVVALSECDRRYISAFSPHTACITNPLMVKPEEARISQYEPDTIIWVGRISKEKQPEDAVTVMRYVVKERPHAVLYMVGSGEEERTAQLKDYIRECGLDEHVVLTGFTLDVESYYRRASVLCGTSDYEGFSLCFYEALAHGVPVAAYDMPWLTLLQDGRGIRTVERNRPDLLAAEILALLRDRERCRALGMQGRKLVADMSRIDIGQEWKQFFDTLGQPQEADKAGNPDACSEDILFRSITEFSQRGKMEVRAAFESETRELREKIRKFQGKMDKLNCEKSEIYDKLQRTYQEKSEINQKLQQTYREKAERGIEIKELKALLEQERNNCSFIKVFKNNLRRAKKRLEAKK